MVSCRHNPDTHPPALALGRDAVCRCGSSKGLTANRCTLACRLSLGHENVTASERSDGRPDHGCDIHDEKEITVRHWIENRLAMLVATYYAAAMAKAIVALPHDELA